MGFNESAIDRLLPRHEPDRSLRLDWNVRMERNRLFKKEEDFAAAEIVDMSLEGALVEVDADQDHEIGDRVVVRFDQVSGHAEIRHKRTSEDREDKLLYGVRFLPDHEFRTAIADAVGTVRGRRSELAEAWNRAN